MSMYDDRARKMADFVKSIYKGDPLTPGEMAKDHACPVEPPYSNIGPNYFRGREKHVSRIKRVLERAVAMGLLEKAKQRNKVVYWPSDGVES